ncbi:MAG: hypothetical protein DSZ08_07600 [Sulfurovum sp.]|nr:MAG: hypothetical protein DSZ08_07600 [Sulfurovum sp.]
MLYRLLVLFIILLNGCSVHNFFVKEQQFDLDTVTVVKYSPYVKEHRAYLPRRDLYLFPNGEKYHYVYHNQKNILGLLLHRRNKFIFYNLSQPKQKPVVLNSNKKTDYTSILKLLSHQGFKTMQSPENKGFLTSVSLKRYKNVKTLLVEVKDYSKLQKLYQTALKTYNASKIQHINTKLPKKLINYDYQYYKKYASTKKEKNQLHIIAKKLGYQTKSFVKKPLKSSVTKEKIVKKKNTTKHIKKILKKHTPNKKEKSHKSHVSLKKEVSKERNITQNISPSTQKKVPNEKSYFFYMRQASLEELSSYLSKPSTAQTLSYIQYNTLTKRKISLREEKILREGSLEELIEAYKKNKNIKYKERIMLLMKNKQTNQLD